jgi:type IV pilus assembly protein PilC
MPVFTYRALNSQGQEVKNDIEAATSDEALEKLRGMNLFPTSVKEKSAKRATPRGGGGGMFAGKKEGKTMAFGKVKQKHLSTFTRQLATLINAGLPIVRSLKILRDQLKPGVLKNALYDVHDDVEGGMTLSEAFAKHPKAFDKLFVNMVKAGEAGGILDQILDRLAGFMEKAERLKKKVISAMIYPAAVVTVAGGILMVIVGYIVPQFEQMFKEMNLDLPAITMVLTDAGRFIANYWYLIVPVPFVLGIIYRLICISKAGR